MYKVWQIPGLSPLQKYVGICFDFSVQADSAIVFLAQGQSLFSCRACSVVFRICTVQIVVTVRGDGERANIKFCFNTGKTATETFQLIEQTCVDSALVHVFLMPRKYSELPWESRIWGTQWSCSNTDMTETVWELIVKCVFTWWKRNSKLAEKEFTESWKVSENGRSALGLFRTIWPMSRRF
jgi:hypothetical protein